MTKWRARTAIYSSLKLPKQCTAWLTAQSWPTRKRCARLPGWPSPRRQPRSHGSCLFLVFQGPDEGMARKMCRSIFCKRVYRHKRLYGHVDSNSSKAIFISQPATFKFSFPVIYRGTNSCVEGEGPPSSHLTSKGVPLPPGVLSSEACAETPGQKHRSIQNTGVMWAQRLTMFTVRALSISGTF